MPIPYKTLTNNGILCLKKLRKNCVLFMRLIFVGVTVMKLLLFTLFNPEGTPRDSLSRS